MRIARTLTGSTTQDEGQERQEAKTQDCQEDKRPETLVKQTSGDVSKRKWKQHGMFQAKGKTGRVDSQQGWWNPLRVVSQEKRRQITLSPFFFACFLLDSASILY